MMALALYGHPFSSYTQKVLIALYENGTPFEFRCIGPDTPQHSAEWLQRNGLSSPWGRRIAIDCEAPLTISTGLGLRVLWSA